MVDWQVHGQGYAAAMVATARRLAEELAALGAPVFETVDGYTRSHQFALRAHRWGGGQAASRLLREANLLACGIGLPDEAVEGDVNGLRIGTPELVRIGLTEEDMPRLASLVVRGLAGERVADEVTAWRRTLTGVHHVHQPEAAAV